MFSNIGPGEVLFTVLVILIFVFGAKKLPELSRALGRSVGEFKKGKEEGARLLEDEKKAVAQKEEAPKPQA